MPLRSKLILYAGVMLLLFLGLSAGAFSSLYGASSETQQARELLAKLSLLESLTEHCSDLGTRPDPLACERARQKLKSLEKQEWAEEERHFLDRVLLLSHELRETDCLEEAHALRLAITELKRALLFRTGEELQAAREPTQRRALRLLLASLLLAAGGSATFAWLYSRLIRERRGLERKLRTSEKLAALGTLAAGLAHEINNPLATISLSAEALAGSGGIESREAASSPADQIRRAGYLQAIQEESERCREIVGGLSDLSRGTALDREAVDVAELASAAVRVLERSGALPENGIEIDVPVDLPLLSADRGKLLQVLVNLLRNALQATDRKGQVHLAVRQTHDQLHIEVTDDGRGIPPHLKERIFEPFYTTQTHGVGLGLALCHRIIELHGGEISAESAGSGQGATFTLTLPLDGG